MWMAIQVYKEVGYPYMLMPDHCSCRRRAIRMGCSRSRTVTGTSAALIQAVVGSQASSRAEEEMY